MMRVETTIVSTTDIYHDTAHGREYPQDTIWRAIIHEH